MKVNACPVSSNFIYGRNLKVGIVIALCESAIPSNFKIIYELEKDYVTKFLAALKLLNFSLREGVFIPPCLYVKKG